MRRDPFGLGLGWGVGVGPFGSVYTATPVNFDGTNDFLTRGGALTGVSDSKVWSGSMWLRLAATGNFERFLNSTNDRFSIIGFGAAGSGGTFAIFGQNAAGSEILDLRSPLTFAADTEWHHYLWSVDLATEAGTLYIDDAAAAAHTDNQFVDDAIDFTDTDLGIGALPNGSNKFSGDMADVWLRFGGAVIDFSVEANRRQFITADGTPADPAGWPSGGQIQLRGALADWHTNKGSGGGFTENGALGAGTGPVQIGSP